MGIEELIGFLLGVACGRLLQCFRGEASAQAKPAEARAASSTETGEPTATSATEAETLVPAEPTETGEPAPGASAATEEAVAVQQTATESPSSGPSAEVEEKRNDLKSAILGIIRSSEEGMTLSAIAEKMKRHFASIIGPVRLLIEEGLVEKQDKLYKIRGPA